MSRTEPTTTPAQNAHTTFASTGAFVTNSRYAKFAQQALVLALLVHTCFAAVFMALGVSLMVWVNLASIALYATAIELARRRYSILAGSLVLLELLGHALIANLVVGWASGFQFYAWLTIPLAAVSTRNNNTRKFFTVMLLCAACVGIDLYSHHITPMTTLPDGVLRYLHSYNLASFLGIMAKLAFVYSQGVAEAEQRLHKHATTDSLTGLRNRRRLLQLAQDELSRASRSGKPVSIIISDLDHFKSINDRFGHPIGDCVMVSVARCLRDCVRRQDHLARWGGEEFIIVLPEIDLQGAYVAAERMRKQIEQLHIATDDNTVRCTASFGVSEWTIQRDETFEQCLGRADAALYAAKQFGRNRVCISEPPELSEHLVAEVLTSTEPAESYESGTHSAVNTTQAISPHRSAG